MRLLPAFAIASPRLLGHFIGMLAGGVVLTAADLVRVNPVLSARSAIVILVTCSLMILVTIVYIRNKYFKMYEVAQAYESVCEQQRLITEALTTNVEVMRNPAVYLVDRAKWFLQESGDARLGPAWCEAHQQLVAWSVGLAIDITITRNAGWHHLYELPAQTLKEQVKNRLEKLKGLPGGQGELLTYQIMKANAHE